MIGELVATGTLLGAFLAGLYVSTVVFLTFGAVVWSEPITRTPLPEDREHDAIGELYRRLETDGGDR